MPLDRVGQIISEMSGPHLNNEVVRLLTHTIPMFPVGRGYAGEKQREIAYRFGVNVVMHVLTGNYKSDQVHIPSLLERLGQ